MKKIKFLTLLSLLLVLVTVLSACNGISVSVKLEKLLDEKTVEQAPVYTAADEIPFKITNKKADLLYDENGSTHTVYSLSLNKQIAAFKEESGIDYTVKLFSSADTFLTHGLFTLKTVNSKTEGSKTVTEVFTSLYDAAGTEMAKKIGSITPSFCADLVIFDTLCFRMNEDGSLQQLCEKAASSYYLTYQKLGEYYVTSTSGSLCFYNDKMEYLSTLYIPTYAENDVIFPLPGNDILVQYSAALPDDAEKYDYFTSDGKYQLITLLFEPKKGSYSELDSTFVLVDCGFDYGHTEGLEKDVSLAYAFEIRNGRTDTSSGQNCTLVSLTKAGNMKKLKPDLPCEEVLYFEAVGNNRWLVVCANTQAYLINEKGEEIGEISTSAQYCSELVLCNGKIFNLDLEELLNYDAEGYDLKKVLGSSVILSDGDNYYRYTAGGIFCLTEDMDFVTAGKGYYVLKNETEYNIYNEKGELLKSVSRSSLSSSGNVFSEASTGDGYLLLQAQNTDFNYVGFLLH